MAAFLPEVFSTSHRFTGTALAFNIAGVFGGGIAPMVSGPLVESYGGFALGLMMAGGLAIRFLAAYLLPETHRKALGL